MTPSTSKSTYFRHTGIGILRVLWMQVGGLLGALVSLVVVAFLFRIQVAVGEFSFLGTCMAVYFLLVGFTISALLFNMYPDVILNPDGISISFMLGRIQVPWDDVCEVKTSGVFIRHTGVIARRITLLHYLYGWIYLHALSPAFVIGTTLERRAELIEAIELRIQAHAAQASQRAHTKDDWRERLRPVGTLDHLLIVLAGALVLICATSTSYGVITGYTPATPTPAPVIREFNGATICPRCSGPEFWLPGGTVTIHVVFRSMGSFRAKLATVGRGYDHILVETDKPIDSVIRLENVPAANYLIAINADDRYDWSISIEPP